MTELQNQLRLARLSKRLRQEDVARKAGMPRQTLSVIESSERPTLERVCRLAEVLGYRVVLVPIGGDAQ